MGHSITMRGSGRILFLFFIWIAFFVHKEQKVAASIWKWKNPMNEDLDGLIIKKRALEMKDSCETYRTALYNLYKIVEEEVQQYETCLAAEADQMATGS